MNFGIVDRLKKAAWGTLGFILAVGLVIGAFNWAFNNKDTFTAVASSAGNAGASVAITTFDWIAQQAGSGTSTANAATVGPQTVWVANTAVGWQVKQAVDNWNKGLTSVHLRYGSCQPEAPCIKVSEGNVYTPEGQSLRLGQTTKLFGKRITLNSDAAGVSARYKAFASCHELGHALGLEHRSAKTSCMHASAKGSATRPDRTDFAAVNAEYGR